MIFQQIARVEFILVLFLAEDWLHKIMEIFLHRKVFAFPCLFRDIVVHMCGRGSGVGEKSTAHILPAMSGFCVGTAHIVVVFFCQYQISKGKAKADRFAVIDPLEL